MKALFEDLMEYHMYFNHELLDMYASGLPERSAELLSHSIAAHYNWNARIIGDPASPVFGTIEVEELRKLNESCFHKTRQIMDIFSRDDLISYSNSKGKEFQSTVRDILMHVFNHYTHHRAQIMSDLRSNGIEPLRTDFIFYQREIKPQLSNR